MTKARIVAIAFVERAIGGVLGIAPTALLRESVAPWSHPPPVIARGNERSPLAVGDLVFRLWGSIPTDAEAEEIQREVNAYCDEVRRFWRDRGQSS